MTVAEIKDPVERAEQLIELVRAEQHGDFPFAADFADDIDGYFLAAGVEADQRLVEQQKFWRPDQRLCEQQPLPLAPRHFGERTVGKLACSDGVKRLFDHHAVATVAEGEPPAFPVKRAGNDIPPANAEIRQYRTQLRQITDRRIPACRRLPEDLYLSDAGRQQAK